MSKMSKILWLGSLLSTLILFSLRYILGGWMSLLAIFLGLSIGCAFAAVLFDFKFYKEFFSLKTTKNGMSMGLVVLIAIALLSSVNYLAFKNNKIFDLTTEKLFSLSDQSQKIIDAIGDDIEFLVFHRGDQDKAVVNTLRDKVKFYEDYSDKVKINVYNSYSDLKVSKEHLQGIGNTDQVIAFIKTGDKKLRLEQPYTEDNITSSLIKITRNKNKKIYFLKGHSERSRAEQGEKSIGQLNALLKASSYQTAEFNFVEAPKVPSDAAVVAIVGPQLKFLEAEVEKLIAYIKTGGRLFLAIDPGEDLGLEKVFKEINIDYKNNYLITPQNQIAGRGRTGIVGLKYHPDHEVSKIFVGTQGNTLFSDVSEVNVLDKENTSYKMIDLIRSFPSAGIESLFDIAKPLDEYLLRSFIMAAENDKTSVIVSGDSDFLTDKDLNLGFNKNLALNIFSYLAGEFDLVSIQPKLPKGTQLVLTETNKAIIIVFCILLPIAFLVMSFILWYRRKNS